jgi:enamine deaminase RidA (YjgF/YER057c/UK114 family)
VEVSHSSFTGEGNVEEHCFFFRPSRYARFSEQLEWIEDACKAALDRLGLPMNSAVLKRFYCSDLPNQYPVLKERPFSDPGNRASGAISLVNQPPMNPSKVSLLLYCIHDPREAAQFLKRGSTFVLYRGRMEHLWTTGETASGNPDSYSQTHALFTKYLHTLWKSALSLESNVLRTWFMVKDIDSNYDGFVRARNEIFARHGLTAQTHFIASTGIEGAAQDVHAKVLMDAYAIKGLQPGQVEYLHALDHLSHTHEYGVAFERATAIHYRDRRQVIVSGTASIDKHGEILHEGNVLRQLDRVLENISALLDQAGANLEDMQHFIVYIRDPSDGEIVRTMMKERVGEKPFEIVTAPVCRPGWLVEIEGIAVVKASNPSLPPF